MIKVYTGTMFSGKSTALINEYNKIQDKNSVVCFKPSKDTRDKSSIRARNVEDKIESIVINSFEEILLHIKEETKYIFIDEVQFIGGDFNVLTHLSLYRDLTIIVAGLNKTSELEPFGQMPQILAIADEIVILRTKCKCGEVALYTGCIKEKNAEILVGDSEYEPLCRKCYLEI